MRISDWSSDVCSSDLRGGGQNGRQKLGEAVGPFQPDGPADLEQSGENENGPSHGAPSFRSVPGPSPAMSGRLPGRPSNHLLSGTRGTAVQDPLAGSNRSEEHTSELQSLMRIPYAVFCLQKK